MVNLYMHEVAMHNDEWPEHVKCSSNTETPVVLLTPAQISALTVCLTSIHGIFDTFLSFATETIRDLPVFHFVRVAYACVLLMKMYFAATTPHAELGKVISKEDLKVEHYFDSLLNAFKAAAENETCRAAQKFLVVLVMLRTYFHKQSGRQSDMTNEPVRATAGHNSQTFPSSGSPNLHLDPDDEIRKERTAPRLGNQHIQLNDPSTQPLHTASTPLHLLSEVATGNSAAASTPGRDMNPTTGQDWYGYMDKDNIHATGTTAVGLPYTGSSLSGDGALLNVVDAIGPKFDWNTTGINEELEQVMNMTLGEWDLSSVLQADGFLSDLGGWVPANVFEDFG